jgi:hypothetical protein
MERGDGSALGIMVARTRTDQVGIVTDCPISLG